MSPFTYCPIQGAHLCPSFHHGYYGCEAILTDAIFVVPHSKQSVVSEKVPTHTAVSHPVSHRKGGFRRCCDAINFIRGCETSLKSLLATIKYLFQKGHQAKIIIIRKNLYLTTSISNIHTADAIHSLVVKQD